MNKKIIVALDLDNIKKAIKLVKELKNEAYAFKIGHEFFYNFGIKGYKEIYNICPKIFLDLKLHDIPNTVQKGLKAISKLKPIFTTLISSAKNGIGQLNNSFKTPLGRHIIRAKIGGEAPINSVFVGRRLTGEVWNSSLEKLHANRDWILTRILWLSGLEKGFNRLGNVDTMKRYIYIHGSPPNVKMGKVGSKGCVRMKSHEIVKLFDIVPVLTTVNLKYL